MPGDAHCDNDVGGQSASGCCKPICVNELVSEHFPELGMRHQQDLLNCCQATLCVSHTCEMADEPEQLGLESRDQETAAQDKALDQLTDHVRPLRLLLER